MLKRVLPHLEGLINTIEQLKKSKIRRIEKEGQYNITRVNVSE